MGPPFITAEWQNAELVGAGFALTASMGPPFITAEWPTTRLRRTAPALRCFNGAAVHHGGVGRTSSTSSATPRIGFNGAAVHHGGVGRERCRRPAPTRPLQWGRRSSRRSGLAVKGAEVIGGQEGFNGAAVHHGGVECARCEGRKQGSGFNGAAVHHGGVAFMSRSIASLICCFNGAAVHHGGVGEQPPIGSLQRDSASMGPPFITAEWGGVAICRGAPLRDAAGFNGAAVHHGGVGGRDSLFLDLLVFELQWGRRSSRRSGGRP